MTIGGIDRDFHQLPFELIGVLIDPVAGDYGGINPNNQVNSTVINPNKVTDFSLPDNDAEITKALSVTAPVTYEVPLDAKLLATSQALTKYTGTQLAALSGAQSLSSTNSIVTLQAESGRIESLATKNKADQIARRTAAWTADPAHGSAVLPGVGSSANAYAYPYSYSGGANSATMPLPGRTFYDAQP